MANKTFYGRAKIDLLKDDKKNTYYATLKVHQPITCYILFLTNFVLLVIPTGGGDINDWMSTTDFIFYMGVMPQLPRESSILELL